MSLEVSVNLFFSCDAWHFESSLCSININQYNINLEGHKANIHLFFIFIIYF